MARLDITTPFVPPGSYPTLPLTALSADLAWNAPGTASDGISFTNTGRQILLAWNQNVSTPRTVTISSVALNGRTGDITTYSIAFGVISVFGPFDPQGWNQTGGKVFAVASATDTKFAVISLDPMVFPR
jgi:hypothetical protein